MSDRPLTVSAGVIREMVRLAALEVAGVLRVGRAGPAWRRAFLGRSVVVRVRDGRVAVRLALIVRPGQPLAPLIAQVRASVGATVERLLGLELESVTVVVDGVGA
jgi:uncharacterized alkaline shock family protein YloU